MKRMGTVIVPALAILTLAAAVALAGSAISAWPFFAEVNGTSAAGIYQFVVPLQVMDKAREDLADLRLIDANGREIPYALQIRRDLDDAREVAGRLFNQTTIGNASEVSVDLGENAGEHNQVEIETSGMNFRRLATVEGSDTASDWRTLRADEVIFSFSSANRAANSSTVGYQKSRYRFLRVKVFADERVDKEPPEITGVRVSIASRQKGELVSWNVAVPSYQLLRYEGAPSSSWTLDLGGRVPCDRLSLTTEDQSFSRPFQVEAIDDPQNVNVVASGEITKHVAQKDQSVSITFDSEVHARKLRLIIMDYSNPTLSLNSITASAPARQLYFELKEATVQPLKLFFGNTNADAPHYDFEKDLAAKLTGPAIAASVGSNVGNPDYRPPPLPFTERQPWLIYVVLTISSVALAIILLSLARATMRFSRDQESTAKVND